MANYKKFRKILIGDDLLVLREDYETEEDYESCIKELFTDDYFFAEYFLERVDQFSEYDAENAMHWIKLQMKLYAQLNRLRPKVGFIKRMLLLIK